MTFICQSNEDSLLEGTAEPEEGTAESKEVIDNTEIEILEDIKILLEDYQKEREEAKASSQVEVATDNQIQIMKEQLNVQHTQLSWVQMIICIGVVFVIAKGIYKLIASYLW